jgi:hypothetical protein
VHGVVSAAVSQEVEEDADPEEHGGQKPAATIHAV